LRTAPDARLPTGSPRLTNDRTSSLITHTWRLSSPCPQTVARHRRNSIVPSVTRLPHRLSRFGPWLCAPAFRLVCLFRRSEAFNVALNHSCRGQSPSRDGRCAAVGSTPAASDSHSPRQNLGESRHGPVLETYVTDFRCQIRRPWQNSDSSRKGLCRCKRSTSPGRGVVAEPHVAVSHHPSRSPPETIHPVSGRAQQPA